MLHIEKKHLAIVAKTVGIQALLFVGILLTVWGSQRIYTAVDPATFEVYQADLSSYVVTAPNTVSKEEKADLVKGVALLDALTNRMHKEMGSTFGWSANDILFNRWVMDNRAYRQFGTYVATNKLFEHYSTVIAKLGQNDREDDRLYKARLNYFNFSPSSWGYFFIPSAEGYYNKAFNLIEKYKNDVLAGKSVYNCRTDDIYSAFNLILGETVFGYALGLLNNSQELPFYTLDNRIYEAQGVILVVRDYLKALFTLYPEFTSKKNNDQNIEAAMYYMDLICNYNPMYITSSFNSGELIISYLLFARNRLQDIRDSIRI